MPWSELLPEQIEGPVMSVVLNPLEEDTDEEPKVH
jgi:hypothetical protein